MLEIHEIPLKYLNRYTSNLFELVNFMSIAEPGIRIGPTLGRWRITYGVRSRKYRPDPHWDIRQLYNMSRSMSNSKRYQISALLGTAPVSRALTARDIAERQIYPVQKTAHQGKCTKAPTSLIMHPAKHRNPLQDSGA